MNIKKHILLRREQILQELPPLTDLIRGSLVERRLTCGKPGCHCASGEGHRAFYLTTSYRRDHTEQVTVPLELVPSVEAWLDNYRRWWLAVEEITALNRELLRKRWIDTGEKRLSKR
jgi:hypothetical protein